MVTRAANFLYQGAQKASHYFSKGTEIGVRHLPSQKLFKASIGLAAISAVSVYFHSYYWLGGAALGAYVAYKARPYQQLMAIRRDILADFEKNPTPAQKDQFLKRIEALWNAHDDVLAPCEQLIRQMIIYMNRGCYRGELERFPLVAVKETSRCCGLSKYICRNTKPKKVD